MTLYFAKGVRAINFNIIDYNNIILNAIYYMYIIIC